MQSKPTASLDWSRFSVAHRRVGGGVTTLIERMIAAGELRPGDKLPPEREIAASLGVSRASVRDAMFELSFKGLIDRRPARGTVVCVPTPGARALMDAVDKDARKTFDIVDLRRVIEPAVCQRAAERATPAEVDALRQNLDDSYAIMPPEEMARLDREFHMLLARAAQNELLLATMSAMADMIHPFRLTSQQIEPDRARSLEEHRRIVEAVRRGDGPAAYQAMTAHILNVGETMLENAGWVQSGDRLTQDADVLAASKPRPPRKRQKLR